MHLEEAWTVIVSYILWSMLRLQRQIQLLFLGCSRVKLSLLFTSCTREGTKCYALFIFYQRGREINRFQCNVSLAPMLIKMPLSLLTDWVLIAHLDQWNHPNLTQGFYKVKRERKDQAWRWLSAEYMAGMAVTLASRRVPPSTEFNPIPPPSSGFPELLNKQRKHRDNIHFNTIAPTLSTPAVCSLKQQKLAAQERSIPPEINQMSDINELCHQFFILKTETGMPSCTVVVLESHLAMVICLLGTPGRCNSFLHLEWESTRDHQQM